MPSQIEGTNYDESHMATYCPEDDKLRLYVGWVDREEYQELRTQGWKATPKQECDFVATWTPAREDMALSYAGEIDDEDQAPTDRAADRAERFAGYRDKRTSEALGLADRYESEPRVHGYQDEKRGERAARRHDRIGSRAVSQWDKAEYWTRRTAGVIQHAIYTSSAPVRMGRIKKLEADLRRIVASYTPQDDSTTTDSEGVEYRYCGQSRGGHWVRVDRLESLKAESARMEAHVRLRLAYENQMLEAQGGRLASTGMEIGGTLGGKVIAKVNKSSKTGRVVSVAVIGPKVDGWAYKTKNVDGTDYALYTIATERFAQSAYTAPTDESRAKLGEFKAAQKAAKSKAPAQAKLINPSEDEAEKLQAIWNAKRSTWEDERKPVKMTQAAYSSRSKGSYAPGRTAKLAAGGQRITSWRDDRPAVVKVREFQGRVVIIVDKPQKALPAQVWEPPPPPPAPQAPAPPAPAPPACENATS
ncbi:MAG: DUF3560 domain-containing protein [Alphaproteobacteria bacterium]